MIEYVNWCHGSQNQNADSWRDNSSWGGMLSLAAVPSPTAVRKQVYNEHWSPARIHGSLFCHHALTARSYRHTSLFMSRAEVLVFRFISIFLPDTQPTALKHWCKRVAMLIYTSFIRERGPVQGGSARCLECSGMLPHVIDLLVLYLHLHLNLILTLSRGWHGVQINVFALSEWVCECVCGGDVSQVGFIGFGWSWGFKSSISFLVVAHDE